MAASAGSANLSGGSASKVECQIIEKGKPLGNLHMMEGNVNHLSVEATQRVFVLSNN